MLDIVEERHCKRHPLTDAWARGELSREQIGRWAVEHWHYTHDLHRLRSEEHTSELQSQFHLVCRLLLEKKKKKTNNTSLDVRHSNCHVSDGQQPVACM